MTYDSTYRAYAERIERRLDELFAPGGDTEPRLLEAVRYSLLSGGKRVRGVMLLAASVLIGDEPRAALDFACAVECIHAYSLIHDDLPAMDNDDFRRGKPSCHKAFGEDMAILAGDALISAAFEIMLPHATAQNGGNAARAALIIAKAAGISGMVSGQAMDIERASISDMDVIDAINAKKTGRLITGALLGGLQLSGPASADISAVAVYGQKTGAAFQLVDDMLDIVGGDIGKTAGKDAASGKITYPAVYGLEKSKELAEKLAAEAAAALSHFGGRADFLIQMAEELSGRVR